MMKMKLFFRMLLCSLALVCFASCSNDNGNDKPFVDDGTYSYFGNIVVTQADNTTFTDENIKVDLVINGADKKVKMVINQVKFAEKMPVRLDVTADGFVFTQTGNVLYITGDKIVPTAAGGKMEKYTITNFKGQLDLDKNEFAMSMICGTDPVSYLGKARLN